MASNTALNSEIIRDLEGQPLDKGAAAFLKAIDQLLTVGAYYSTDHDQYRVVSEKSCAQMVDAIGTGKMMAIEVTASGMMVRSQLVDPNHRNVRLLHDLLVPLNIARLEISADLSAADLRLAISALQLHKQNLGNTTGFQEIKIENLPPTVSTASRGVVRDNGNEISGDKGSGLMTLDEMFGVDDHSEGRAFLDDLVSDSEKLAREFMEIVTTILENLEQDQPESSEDGVTQHPDTTPENITALREALRRLVEVNPDPADLARLIEHAKRALDLSRDPGSVDLVFSLLKKEVEHGGDWKYKAREKAKDKPKKEYRFSLDELRKEISDLEILGREPEEPGPSALSNYLGICFHLLGADPAEGLEINLVSNLERIINGEEITREDLNLCSAAVATSALKDNQVALDTVLPAFCNPLRASRPDYLVKFWVRLWETLGPDRRALVWPHLVSDLLLGIDNISPGTIEGMWLAAGELESKTAIMLVSRLECTPALRGKTISASLMTLPLVRMYPVHLALMKSSQASVHGPRLHNNLLRHPPNGLTE
ncbi:MAG: hypothetical protein KAH56_13475, partial [Candidatus Krumholzibacteria bacterium]|nr:hypothetical protein [Candidatus Krumholzibacteria bacterium]